MSYFHLGREADETKNNREVVTAFVMACQEPRFFAVGGKIVPNPTHWMNARGHAV